MEALDSFLRVLEIGKELPKGSSDPQICKISGIIVRKRLLSKKLLFLDLVEVGTTGPILELIVKHPPLNVDEIGEIRRTIGMGDEVIVSGFVENSEKAICFHVTNILRITQNENLINVRQSGKNLQDRLQIGALGQREKPITPLCSGWWKNAQNCPKGDKCPRRHYFVDEDEKARYEVMYHKRLEQKKQGHDPDDPCICKTSHYLRAIVFVEWLLKTFSKEALASGNGVLDIAGGKGAVSFELTSKHSVPSTLVEPRPMKFGKIQYKFLKQHKKRFGTTPPLPIQIQSLFGEEFVEQYKGLLENSSLLIGMHPDQATELIVDYALKYNKPFAVIPCCVFHRCFPDRKTANGAEVVQYQDFITYLTEKDPAIKVEFLPFEGRNKILFKT